MRVSAFLFFIAVLLGAKISHAESLTAQLTSLKRGLAAINSQLASYALQNPVRTLAVGVTFGGIYKGMTGYMDDADTNMTLIAAGYCALNYSNCVEATTYLGPLLNDKLEYENQIDRIKTALNHTEQTPSQDSSEWISGSPHPTYEHVIAGTTKNNWIAAPGYKWLNPDNKSDLSVIAKEMIGIGITFEINTEITQPQILNIFSNSPAEHAGITRGMIISQIDGIPTKGRSIDKCKDLLTGKEGTEVVLQLLHPINNTLTLVKIVRKRFST